MSAKKLRALVIAGDGINCERETAWALSQAGFEAVICQLGDLEKEGYAGSGLLKRAQALALPGGFSYGDDLGSGKVLALKIKHRLRWDLSRFAQEGGMVIGICNGFQALLKLGLFGRVSITLNREGKFLNRWVNVNTRGERCLWLRGISSFEVPIRHGEGRLVFADEEERLRFMSSGRSCLTYEHDVNGSADRIAGLCDASGRILGLMPHPEAIISKLQHPERTAALGIQLFENAFRAVGGQIEKN